MVLSRVVYFFFALFSSCACARALSCACCRVCGRVCVVACVLSCVCCRVVSCSVVVLSLCRCLRWFVCEFCVAFFRCARAVVALCCVLFLLHVRVCVCGFLWRRVRVALLPCFSLFFLLLSFFLSARSLSLPLCSTHPRLDKRRLWSLLKRLAGVESPSMEQGGRRRWGAARIPFNP